MTTVILIVLIVACTMMEINPKIDTNSIIGKIAVLFIVVGAGLKLFSIDNELITYSVAVYFANKAYLSYSNKHNRRKADHLPKKRKILS